MWNYQTEAFSSDYRVILYDHRGHGKSDKPKDNYSIETLSNDLHAVVQNLHLERVNLIGFSMGGQAALACTLKHSSKIAKLILVGTTAKMAWPMHSLRFVRYILPYRTILAIVSREKYQRPSPQTIDANISRATQVPRDIAYKCLLEILNYDVRDMLSEIKITTLIIVGERDRLNLKGSQYLHRRITGSNLQIMANTGHTVMIERPKEFNQLVRQFIAEK
jgi:3-oxoadipate enol-lactonase